MNHGLGSMVPFLVQQQAYLQFALCLVGTALGLALVVAAIRLPDHQVFRGYSVRAAVFYALLVLGCAVYAAPFGSLNGDGGVHQSKIWFVAEALRHGTLPEWTFMWFGGGTVSELYGPLYYVFLAIPVLILGVTTKWSVALVVVSCFIGTAIFAQARLTKTYGFFAASVAAFCCIFSPAHTAAMWYDGGPHRVIVHTICVVYVIYLWQNYRRAAPFEIGLYLAIASALSVDFHLQFGGMATLLLFGFTAAVLAFHETLDLRRAIMTCVIAAAVFLPAIGLHYVYYFHAKPDLVADSDSILSMFAAPQDRLTNFLAASLWDWTSRTWEVHYVGLVPLLLCAIATATMFRRDRFVFVAAVFAIVVFALTPFAPRLSVFVPVFYVPTIAAVIHFAGVVLARDRQNCDRRVHQAASAIAVLVLLDLYPSAFHIPYRPGSGDQPIARALADLGLSRGRVAIVSPDVQYANVSADRFPGAPQLASPSLFGPTFQLGTKALGYAAGISRQAWLDIERTGAITPARLHGFALLDVSDVFIHRRDTPPVRIAVEGFRPAWRIENITCSSDQTALTRLNWDDIRALGFGEKDELLSSASEMTVNPDQGTVSGVALACTGLESGGLSVDNAKPTNASTTVSRVEYNAGLSSAAFSIDTGTPGVFLMPFGYTRDLRIERDGVPLQVTKSSQGMSVVAIPAGRSDIRITARLPYTLARRGMDVLFLLLLGCMGVSAASGRAPLRLSRAHTLGTRLAQRLLWLTTAKR